MGIRLKKGDTVVVISGKDKGKKGKVLTVSDKGIIVEKINVVKKHQRPTKNFQGGIIEKALPLNPSKVMPFCVKCSDGVRVRFEHVEGKNVRKCASCGEVMDKVK
jgi:large subunit ribosomal protein L24